MTSVATLSGAEFDRLPYEEGRKWELVNGELIPMASPTLLHQRILQKILVALALHLNAHADQGESFTDIEFALSPDYRVRPDVLVLGPDFIARVDIRKIPVPGAPDLAVEIISPSERSGETQAKILSYLRFGTSEVWQVYPELRTVVAHREGRSETVTAGVLTSALLPGFLLEIDRVFA